MGEVVNTSYSLNEKNDLVVTKTVAEDQVQTYTIKDLRQRKKAIKAEVDAYAASRQPEIDALDILITKYEELTATPIGG